ncbi:MAG: Lar family restriction alleviation protein [Clostridia bacterium]|nr:Lar family restriction alleviation protein [Clostridia bacterium]
MDNLKPCPICGSRAKWCISSNRKHRLEYGINCSNPKCGWSYAYTVFNSRENAMANWEKKVSDELQLQEWSKDLAPCECGAKPSLVFEYYGVLGGAWFVRCRRCGKLQTGLDTKEHAVTAWNRRANDADN